jgi:hypothetical protein
MLLESVQPVLFSCAARVHLGLKRAGELTEGLTTMSSDSALCRSMIEIDFAIEAPSI